jgi:hypothetical protein
LRTSKELVYNPRRQGYLKDLSAKRERPWVNCAIIVKTFRKGLFLMESTSVSTQAPKRASNFTGLSGHKYQDEGARASACRGNSLSKEALSYLRNKAPDPSNLEEISKPDGKTFYKYKGFDFPSASIPNEAKKYINSCKLQNRAPLVTLTVTPTTIQGNKYQLHFQEGNDFIKSGVRGGSVIPQEGASSSLLKRKASSEAPSAPSPKRQVIAPPDSIAKPVQELTQLEEAVRDIFTDELPKITNRADRTTCLRAQVSVKALLYMPDFSEACASVVEKGSLLNEHQKILQKLCSNSPKIQNDLRQKNPRLLIALDISPPKENLPGHRLYFAPKDLLEGEKSVGRDLFVQEGTTFFQGLRVEPNGEKVPREKYYARERINKAGQRYLPVTVSPEGKITDKEYSLGRIDPKLLNSAAQLRSGEQRQEKESPAPSSPLRPGGGQARTPERQATPSKEFDLTKVIASPPRSQNLDKGKGVER